MAKFIGIHRHRIGTDGHGITTLVGFHGCPLRCRYCLNPQCNEKETKCIEMNAAELFSFLKRDELYFLATNGGVTFGGGEPAVHSEFIEEFRDLCGPSWMINIETCLNVPTRHIEKLCKTVDTFYIDIKDMNPEIYISYTSVDNNMVYTNLHLLSDYCKVAKSHPKVVIRTPLIPNYNKEKDICRSIEVLQNMGFDMFDRFTYNTEYGKRKTKM